MLRLHLILTDSCSTDFILQVFTEMHSMPNGEHALEQAQEGEDSTEDSAKWDSQGYDEEEESEESDEEEEVDSPPRSEHRSK